MALDFRSIDQPLRKSTDALLKENEHLRARIHHLEHRVLELTSEMESLRHEKISAYVPDGMYPFHPETQAIIAAKPIEERLTFKLIENSFDSFSDFHITTQGALNVFERVDTILLPVYNYLGSLLQDTDYLYADETTWPINGVKKWSWYFGNEFLSYYQFDTSRSQQVP